MSPRVPLSMFVLPVGDLRWTRSVLSQGHSHSIELDENAREVRGLLYCQPCHGTLELSVCAACRRLIDDRVVSALGQQWHVEVCIESRAYAMPYVLLASISAVRVALNRFVAADISSTKAWRTARPIIISCLARVALSATGLSPKAVSVTNSCSRSNVTCSLSVHGVQ